MALASIAAIAGPLLLATVSTDIAAARGVPVRLVGLLFMLALAVSVGLSVAGHRRHLVHGPADRPGRRRAAPDQDRARALVARRA